MKDKSVENYILRTKEALKQLKYRLNDFESEHHDEFKEFIKDESTQFSLKSISSYVVKPEK